MQRLIYLLAYPFLWLVSILPFPLLYALSDFVFFLVYRLIGYRRKVVWNNLKLVFPDKPQAELKTIERKFYAHMCDIFLEMIKTMNISEAEIKKRYAFTNLEVILEFEKKGRSAMLMLPHYASWEWVFSLNTEVSASAYGIYQPINNKYFDRLVRSIRAKFGTTLIATKQIWDITVQNKKTNTLAIYGIISDQSPMVQKAHYWAPFMGVIVPIHTGAEFLCKKYDLMVYYLKVKKVGRGYYSCTFKLLAEDPGRYPDYEITDMFLKEVETSINEAPEYYFWTHKRWKHKDRKPNPDALVRNKEVGA